MSIRVDSIGFGNISIMQDSDEFCYGVDAVMLSDFASKNAGKYGSSCKIMDLGTGTGIIPLILSHKTDASYIGGVEVQNNSYHLAEQNMKRNSLEDRLHFFHVNVKDFPVEVYRDTFDIVTCNPPYMKGACGITSKNKAKGIARHETLAELKDFVQLAANLLRDKGEFCMVHRPSRLVDICQCCRELHLEPKELVFISGKPMEKPNILLIRCIKNGNRELRIGEPISVHNENGTYSEEILKMYEK